MARKKIATGKEADGELERVIEAFKPFTEEGYALNPHSGGWISSLFDKAWQVFAGIIILTVLSVGITFLRADDRQGLITRLGTQLKYPYFSFTWCADFDELGLPVSRIFPRGEILDCEELLSGTEVASAPRLLGRDRETNILVWNTIADYLPLCLSMLLSLITFRGLTRKVPRYLLELAQAGRLRPPREKKALTGNGSGEAKAKIQRSTWGRIRNALDIRPRSRETFAEDFEKALHHPIRHFLFLFWLAIGFTISRQFAISFRVFELQDFWQMFAYFMILGVTVLFMTYIAGYGIWTMVVSAAYIRKLSPTFDLDIEPCHGDGCGGLKRLGDLCLEMALMIIYPMTVLAFFFLSGNFSASLPEFKVGLIIGGVTAIIIAGLVFFWPLLDIHRDMVEHERKIQDQAAASIGAVEEKLRDLLGSQEYNANKAKPLEARLEKLNKVYPANLNYPTWPFTTRVILIFYTSQIVPIITVAIGLIDFIGKLGSSGTAVK